MERCTLYNERVTSPVIIGATSTQTILHGPYAIVAGTSVGDGFDLSPVLLVVHCVNDEEGRDEGEELHKCKHDGGNADTVNVAQQVEADLVEAAVPPQTLHVSLCVEATVLVRVRACAIQRLAARRGNAQLFWPGVDVVPIGVVVHTTAVEIGLHMIPGGLDSAAIANIDCAI